MKNILFLFCIVLASCEMKPQESVAIYFDTDSLMKVQKMHLYEQRASISKNAKIGDQKSEGLVKPDSIDAWDREFQMLQKININKPALKGSYDVRVYDDPKSNLTIKEFMANEDDLEVPYLKLYYLKNPDQLRILEASYVEENPIFESRRDLKFIFEDFTGSLLLHEYTIKGKQKMILMDEVEFDIQGKVKL